VTEGQQAKAGGRLAGLGWRSAAIAAEAAVTGIGALVVLADPAPQTPHYTVGVTQDAPVPGNLDPLRAELARCRTLPADTDDARCRAAWEVNRRRFMGEIRSLPVPVELKPVPALGPILPFAVQDPER
jgi:conjugative transfer region protein TrbK